jgi:hypothetical protein
MNVPFSPTPNPSCRTGLTANRTTMFTGRYNLTGDRALA